MDLINEVVQHRQFGSGTVIGQTVSMITVEFCADYGQKKFFYPAAFESFLELGNPSAKQYIEQVIQEKRADEAQTALNLLEAEKLRLEESHRTLLVQKRSVAKKKAADRKLSVKAAKKAAESYEEDPAEDYLDEF